MSLFEQTLINNYVFSENDKQVSGGAPITELIASQTGEMLKGGSNKNPLTNKKHLSVPVGLVMMSHTEYVFPSQRFHNPVVQENLFNHLFENVEENVSSSKQSNQKSDSKSKSKSLKLREKKMKKQTKKTKPVK
jgi:hypothetical protein